MDSVSDPGSFPPSSLSQWLSSPAGQHVSSYSGKILYVDKSHANPRGTSEARDATETEIMKRRQPANFSPLSTTTHTLPHFHVLVAMESCPR